MYNRAMRFSRVTRNFSKLLDLPTLGTMDRMSKFTPSPLSLKQFVEFGRSASEADSFNFLKREIPVRLANIMKEMNIVPSNLLEMPSVQMLQEWYAASFTELCAFEGRNHDRETLRQFVELLRVVQQRHANAVQTMAHGVLELKETHAVDKPTEARIQYFLDRFYMSRISTRMLTSQHSDLYGYEDEEEARYNAELEPFRVGMIDTQCDIVDVIQAAFKNAAFLSENFYSIAPEMDLAVSQAQPDQPLCIVHPPQQLYHVLFELFKNSMRATIENRPRKRRLLGNLPDIRVQVARGKNDVTVKVSDQGGGIPRHINDRLFHYLYSTAPRPDPKSTEPPPLAGYGYGLPLSRLYARYFHGDLVLNSLDGYGTDAIVYVKANADEAVELLPIFNKTSTKQYQQATPTPDWTDPAAHMGFSFPHYLTSKEAESSSP